MVKFARIMMAAGTACLACVLTTGGASAQETWTRQSPYPADVELHDVHFITEDYGWISGEDDLLMFTTDGGTTWQQTPSVHRDPLFLRMRSTTCISSTGCTGLPSATTPCSEPSTAGRPGRN